MAAQEETFEQVKSISLFVFLYLDIHLQFDEDVDSTETSLAFSSSGRKRLFSKELRCMMFGFGDDQNPYTESVDIIEDLVIEFITEMTHK